MPSSLPHVYALIYEKCISSLLPLSFEAVVEAVIERELDNLHKRKDKVEEGKRKLNFLC
jgi:hypothetical protein